MKKSLIAIFPDMQLDNPLIPYSMLKLVVNEFKRSNFLENVDDKLYQGIIILMGIGFEIGDISMLINMKEKDIMNITTENARKLIRDWF